MEGLSYLKLCYRLSGKVLQCGKARFSSFSKSYNEMVTTKSSWSGQYISSYSDKKSLSSRTFHLSAVKQVNSTHQCYPLQCCYLSTSTTYRTSILKWCQGKQKTWMTGCSSVRLASTEQAATARVRGIQKDISPLTTRRVVRRKQSKDTFPKDQELFDVTAYATAEELRLEELTEALREEGHYQFRILPNVAAYTTAEEYCMESLTEDLARQGLYRLLDLADDVEDALYVEAKYRVDDEPREIFFFREGSVVFWNMPIVERVAVLRFLKRHQEGSYDDLLMHEEYEQIEFTYSDNDTRLIGDEIQFRRPLDRSELEDHQLEKYAFANALATSVKLAIWEASLSRYVDSIEWVLQDLKDGKKIRMSRSDILRKTGELFTLRHLINLSSDLLDTPDFYWDRPTLEDLYSKTCSNFSIKRRTKVMNEKLNHCCELADLINDHLKDKHHTRLEWMIIVLILVEVIFEIEHMITRHSED